MNATPGMLDAVILGGGVAGLWTLRRLLAEGRSAVLLTTADLGAGQTVASQGIIHGGIKYALGGAATAASRAIAGMPDRWRACLAGRPGPLDPDLSGAAVLAREQHLWTTPGLVSRVAAAAASKAIRTPVQRLDAGERPGAFERAPAGVDVYRVAEPVLDAASLVRALAGPAMDRIGRVASVESIERIGVETVRTGVRLHDGRAAVLSSRAVVLCAGSGNGPLAGLAGARASDLMQTRPLHMALARGAELAPLFGHCLGASTTPRLTVTSWADAAGRVVWYLGGALAERGVGLDAAAQRAAARAELNACVPWAVRGGVELATLRIDRAEGLRADGSRPDEPVVTPLVDGRVLAAWPTKLALAPLLAERVSAALPAGAGDGGAAPPALQRPGVAPLPFDAPGLEWAP
ncbi:MAG: FAD-dependent oxidoreductase [Phycisphaerae bacterium]|nr:FAD-dependent oxidoreductase [Phycisphaerae bacterium]